jgi:CPA1 family monovalent cation:H+ antiporter
VIGGARLDMGTTFVLLFAVASVVAIAARRIRVPYPVALLLTGVALSAINGVDAPQLTQEVLFALVLPGLIFEAAYSLRARDLYRNWRTLFLLSIPGVAVAIAVTAALTPVLLDLLGTPSMLAAGELLAFAALISATDPVAVLALFRKARAPARLTLLIEAESLLNDATAIVFFLGALSLAGGGLSGGSAWFSVSIQFVRTLLGGTAIGLVIGGVVAWIIARVDDPMVEVTLTVVAAYGSFAVAQRLGLSGVIATTAAGVLCGHDVARRGMSAGARIAVGTFWEYAAFALTSTVFLLMGLDVHLSALAGAWQAVIGAFIAVMVARAIVIGAATLAIGRSDERIPWQWGAVLTWGGLRGALSIVLALALPASLPHRQLLITMTFGVVVLSLIGPGLSMPAILRRFGVPDEPPAQPHGFAGAGIDRESLRAAAIEE